jgi:hypothetical protein
MLSERRRPGMKIINFILFWIALYVLGNVVAWTLVYIVAVILGFLMSHFNPNADIGYP